MSTSTIRTILFGIPEHETRFDRRGFEGGTPATRARIEEIGRTFVAGYRAALAETRPGPLSALLDMTENERRGFAYEGAAMALTLLDLLTPWPGRRLATFLQGPGDAHAYMVHVGAGWALARLPRRVEANLHRFDPLLRWLALDGYGFHQGYFHWRRFVAGQERPRRLSPSARRAFDQGLGRSLWFVHGAEPERIAGRIASFSAARQADLWSGLGLACAYAGGVPESDLADLRVLAAGFQGELAQGIAFAAKARERAGNPAPHTDLACRVICGIDAARAAAITDEAREGLPPDGTETAFEVWRRRIRARLQPDDPRRLRPSLSAGASVVNQS